MRRTLTAISLFGFILGLSAPAGAVDPKVFNCEKAVVLELAKFSRARGKCITTCVTKKQAKPTTYSCSPPFDVLGTQACADKTVLKYSDLITAKCSGNMPACGGYEKGFCSDNTALSCDRDGDCTFGENCVGRCSTTTSLACSLDSDCPLGETCTSGGAPKDIPDFIVGNLFEGSPLSIINQIDLFSEGLFQCRQSVCSGSGDYCTADGECPLGETCTPGKCSNGSACAYDGDCGTGTTKKCLPLGRCSNDPQSCLTAADCPSGTCDRYGRCGGSGNNGEPCFTPADCPNPGGTCGRTLTDTDRKTEQKCGTAVAAALAKFTFDMANCQAKCALERDLKDGFRCTDDTAIKCKTDADCAGGALSCQPTSCDPFAIGRCSNDIDQVCAGNGDCASPGVCNTTTPAPISKSLDDCRTKAFDKAVASINTKCPSLPLCGAYGPFGGAISNLMRPEDLIGFVTGQQDGQFKEDDPDLSPGSNFCAP